MGAQLNIFDHSTLVEDEEGGCGVAAQLGLESAFEMRGVEGVDDVDGVGEEHAHALLAGGVTQGGGEVGLAQANQTEEDDVGFVVDELAKITPCKRASLAYASCKPMVFYETDVFTARIVEFIGDESYSALQAVLVADPEAGDLIPKTRGLRKIRWMGSGRGKRGGIRVIYYLVCQDEIFMLYAYPKNRESDLSPRHLQMLRELVEQHLEQ